MRKRETPFLNDKESHTIAQQYVIRVALHTNCLLHGQYIWLGEGLLHLSKRKKLSCFITFIRKLAKVLQHVPRWS